MGSYIPYPFSMSTVGNQLLFTFTGLPPATSQLNLPNPYYLNIPNLYIKLDRLRSNIVHFGDEAGIISVDYTLSTNPSPAGGLLAWMVLVIGLLPATSITTNTNNVFSAIKTSAQTFTSNTAVNVMYNSTLTTCTDLSYNSITGVFTVNTTGDYHIDAYSTHQAAATAALFGLRFPVAATTLVKFTGTNQLSSGTTSNGKFMITWPFTAGDTFAIAYYSISANTSAYVAETNQFYITIKRIPTILT